jgi:hypothetical protein
VCLQISTTKYNESDKRFDGDLHVSRDETGRYIYSLELRDDPELERLEAKPEILFKVHPEVRKVSRGRKPTTRRR